MNKNYREYIGRLARYDQSGRSSIFINRMNIIQYNVKTLLLPDAATSFVTGFGNLLPLGNVFQGNIGNADVLGKIDHDTERIATTGRYHHNKAPFSLFIFNI